MSSAIILSGGKSLRMAEKDKAFLQIGQKSLILAKLDFLRTMFEKIIIVTNKPEDYHNFPAKIVTDQKPETGPLMGLYSGRFLQ